jgi:isopentenyl-diphosphate delta-isomerase type 1
MPLDNQSELFYLVNDRDEVISSISRHEAHADRTKIHRSTYIIAKNAQRQILLQQRSQKKDTKPGYWDLSVAGHVTYGQSYDQAAERELAEELGVHAQPRFLKKMLIPITAETEYVAIYEVTLAETPMNLDHDEVERVKWIDVKKLPTFIAQQKMSEMAIIVLKELGYIPKETL